MPYNPTNWQDGPTGGTPINSGRLNNIEGGISALGTQLAADEALAFLNPTAVKTANYSAAVGDFVPVDASGGARAISLPLAPANRSRVAVKKMDSSSNAVTVTVSGGADVINQSGTTLLNLTLQFQAMVLEYAATAAIWYVVSTDAPIGQLSVTVAGNTVGIGGSVTQDQITGLSATGLVKRTGTNTLAPAVAGTDYQTPGRALAISIALGT